VRWLRVRHADRAAMLVMQLYGAAVRQSLAPSCARGPPRFHAASGTCTHLVGTAADVGDEHAQPTDAMPVRRGRRHGLACATEPTTEKSSSLSGAWASPSPAQGTAMCHSPLTPNVVQGERAMDKYTGAARDWMGLQRDAAVHAVDTARSDAYDAVRRSLTRATDAARDQRDLAWTQLSASASHAATAACQAVDAAVSDAVGAAVGAVAAETAPYRLRASRFFETGQVHPTCPLCGVSL
jgi:hypothetical protein